MNKKGWVNKSCRSKISPGDIFGRLTVIGEGDLLRLPSGQVNRTMLCKCDCGKTKQVRLVHLKHKRIISCGCVVGEFHGREPRLLYQVWHGMRQRCSKDYNDHKHRYKDRGISVCDEWERSFNAFREWALANGYVKGLQIDRIDNNSNYSPANCRFVTRLENANNKEHTIFVNYNGESIAIMPLLRNLRKDHLYHTIRRRILRGWEHQKAIDTPMRAGNYKRINRHL